jgi:tryptophan-rich sensory protein
VGKSKGLVGLLTSVGVCFGVAVIGGLVTSSAIPGWYARLRKPSWSPPNWVFGPVWSALYALMAVAAWLAWRRSEYRWSSPALRPYIAQLALNLGWTIIFFGFKRPGVAVGEIALLWASIAATMKAFWPVTRIGAVLLLPYLAWVSFASALNFAVWAANRKRG